MTDQISLFDIKAQVETLRAENARKASDAAAWMQRVSGAEWRWFVKVLRGNDTLLTIAHQAGPYMSRQITFELFPSFARKASENVTATITAVIDSHDAIERPLNVKWWGSSKHETHLTGWGGKKSPVLDPDATGSIIVIAFHQLKGHDADGCRIWLCTSVEEEEAVQERVGSIEPGNLLLFDPASGTAVGPAKVPVDSPCGQALHDMPEEWLYQFPSAATVVAATVERMQSALTQSPDDRLVKRRDCEYELFRSIEQLIVMPRIHEGFGTVDLFVEFANSVTNRRKSRSGSSLGLQTSTIFNEEKLPHSYDKVSEGKKRPDFLFPSADAYHAAKDGEKLVVLAAKTTCKDRWRQVINEANKIPTKHLLTLQEGISPAQFEEMQEENVVLVVPSRLHKTYHKSIQPKLVTLSDFIAQTKERCALS